MSREEFRALFRQTPLWRSKYEGLLRNICTVMGNSGDPKYIPVLKRLENHEDAAVTEHARWALSQIDKTKP
jgi:epoxyqueuosine reductase